MDEPRDDIDTWLEERVTPLQPHPGTFEQISLLLYHTKIRQVFAEADAFLRK